MTTYLPMLKNTLSLLDDNFGSDLLANWPSALERSTSKFHPKTSVTERDADYLLELEAPGVKKEDITLEMNGEWLTVTGEKKEKKVERKEDGFHYSESSYGKFSRSWKVQDIDTDKIKASFKDGVLEIVLPKKSAENKKNTKKITVS